MCAHVCVYACLCIHICVLHIVCGTLITSSSSPPHPCLFAHIQLCAARASRVLLHFYNDQPMKALIAQAKERLNPGQVTEDELSRIESLLDSEDWRTASSQEEIAQSGEMEMDTLAVNHQSFHTMEEHPQIDSHLEAKIDLQMEAGMETFHEEGLPDVVPNEGRVEQRENLKSDLKVKVGLDSSPLPDISAVSTTAEEIGDGNAPTEEFGNGNAQDPVQPQMSEAAPVHIEQEEPGEIRTMKSSDTVRQDPSELEASMVELTTPLRSWSFKKSEKKGLEFSDFSPVRVVRSKSKGIQRKHPAASQTSSLANSPDVTTPVVTPSSLPSAQEVISQEIGRTPGSSTMLSSSQEISSIVESQEMPPAVSSSETSRSHKTSTASQEEFSGSQEVIISSLEITSGSHEVTSSSSEVISSTQEVLSSSQEVMCSSQEVQARTSFEEITSSGVSSLAPSVTVSPHSSLHLGVSGAQSRTSNMITAPPHSMATAPPHSMATAPPHSTATAPPHSMATAPPHSTATAPLYNEKATQQKKQETSSEEETGPKPKQVASPDEAQVNDRGIFLAEGQLEPGLDALGVQLSTLKQGGTALLSKVKTLAGKGKDRFTSSELGSKMEKPVTKMKEILSTFATPPTHEPRPQSEPMRSEPDAQVPGQDTTTSLNAMEVKFPSKSPVDSAESVEETDSSAGKKADIEKLKDITAIVRYVCVLGWSICEL